jgi:hypothetical protein
MAIPPDSTPYGSQTVTGPGWPNVDEETLAAAAATYETLASKITGSIVPQQQGQLMKLADQWEGAGSLAAAGEATTIIGGHEANAAHAAAIALKLRAMEATVVKAKMLANTIAQEVQHECEAIAAMPFSNAQELVQSRVKMGLSQNIANVTAHTTELANTLAVPPSIPFAGAAPSVPGGKEAKDSAEEATKQAGGGSQQAMQMLSQLGSMAGQLPQMLMQIPQQMGQQLQQLSQPLQQLTSMFGSGGKADSIGAAGLPFSSFSNHPAAGGTGAGGGSGLVKAASLPGSGGSPLQTPQMANLVGTKSVSTSPQEGAAAGVNATAGAVPMAAGGGMGGMAPMMGQRGESGGTSASLAVPAPLDHDFDDGDVDDDW